MESEHKLAWWNSAYTWYAVILIVVVVVISIAFTIPETSSPTTWYANLRKSPGIPPGWVFSVVWSVLYVLLLAGVIIAAWNYHNSDSYTTMCLYTLILLMTLFWCGAFFGLHDIILGAIIIVLLLILAGMTIWFLYPSRKEVIKWWDYLPFAFYILFFVWICCATYFNIGIGVVNGVN